MEKTKIQWQAKPVCKQVSSDFLIHAISTLVFCVVLSIAAPIGVLTADATFPKVLWVILGVAVVVYSVDDLQTLFRPLIRKLKTEYVLTADTLFIQVGKTLKVQLPYDTAWTPCFVPKKNGLVDIRLYTSSGINVVLSDIREDDELYKVFGQPPQAS